jgi:hypothetical protein
MSAFGKGPTLREACSWLQDDASRHAQILEVTERNSVIEGLPRFEEDVRRQILEQLQVISRDPGREPPESSSTIG